MLDPAASFQEHDQEFFERELAAFLPERIFDMHCHLWNRESNRAMTPPGFPEDVGCDEYLKLIEPVFPGREVGAWILPTVALRDPETSLLQSEWVSDTIAGRPRFAGAFLIRPGDDPEWVREQGKRLGLRGLKCYHTFSRTKPTWEADIPAYLPEELVRVAHEEGWIITLHMVKSRAAADPGNQHWIRHYCETYPDMRLVLAHSARGFQPAHNFDGLPALRGLDNLYFDSSANCDAMAHVAILRIIGHERFMMGTDFGPASHQHGRSVPVADTFLWLYDDAPVWQEKHTTIRPVLIILEHLRSLKWACQAVGLTDRQVEDVFHDNAARLLGLE